MRLPREMPCEPAGQLQTRLGPLAYRSTGSGPTLVFLAGAFANHDMWRDVIATLDERHRCLTIDLPLGAHPWPLEVGADRSARSLAGLLLDALELLELDEVTLVANDTAGGLLLLALASGHRALARIVRLVLTNCESYEKFPPRALKPSTAVCRTAPGIARWLIQRQLRSPTARRRAIAMVTAHGLDPERERSFYEPVQRDRRIARDFVAAAAGQKPALLLEAASAIPNFERPVLVLWGDACRFFPLSDAHRLVAAFPNATLTVIRGARTWVAVDAPQGVADALARFLDESRSDT